MSKATTAVFGALLAVGGFALGYFFASAAATGGATPERLDAEQAQAALAAMAREPATLDNARRLADQLAALGPDAVAAILPTLRDPSEDLDATRALLLIQYWADRDPKSIAEWATTNAPFLYKTLARQLAVERLAETDLQAARKLAGTDRHLLKPLVRGWVRSGQPDVEEWIRELGYGFERQMALGAYARAKIRREGIAATIAWVEALPDTEDRFRPEAFPRVISELAYEDPAAGLAFYEKHRDGPHGADLLSALANAWVAADGPAAMRWLSERPEGKDRDGAVVDAVRAWSMGDFEALRRWTPSAPGDPVPAWFQPALPVYAKLAGAREPLKGIPWAERIEDPAQRTLTLVQIARRWYQRDPAAADAWLAQSQLSETERASARKPFAPPARGESAGGAS